MDNLRQYAVESKFADPALPQAELDALVRSVLEVLEQLSSAKDEFSAYGAGAWIDILAKAAPRSQVAIERLVTALDDNRAFNLGSSPYDSYPQTVADRAQSALYPTELRARALPLLVSSLDRLSAAGRVNATRVLGWYAFSEQSAIVALERLASDPDERVRQAAGIELEFDAQRER